MGWETWMRGLMRSRAPIAEDVFLLCYVIGPIHESQSSVIKTNDLWTLQIGWLSNWTLISLQFSARNWRSLRQRANARNVSFRISLRWPIYIVNSVDKTKLSPKTWCLHAALYIFEWNNFRNNNAWLKIHTDLNLGEVVYISIIYHIPDSWLNLLNG